MDAENKKIIPEMNSYDEIADFWDAESLADYWDETEAVEFEVESTARRHYYVALDRDLLQRIQKLAQSRGVSTQNLVNLLLEQRVHQLEKVAA